MDLSAVFSNDQLAVLGCFAALAVCGIIAAVTYHVGPAGRKSQPSRIRKPLQLSSARSQEADSSEQRKAA